MAQVHVLAGPERRRLIGKAEHLAKGANPRLVLRTPCGHVVTALKPRDIEAKTLFERAYCVRGEMENRIKKC